MSIRNLETITGKAWAAFTNTATEAANPVLKAGATAVVGLGTVAGAAALDAGSNPAMAVEEGECLPTEQMSRELQAHNMKPFMSGDFAKKVDDGGTPDVRSDDEYKLNMAMITATPDGDDVWILKGDTPKGTPSSEFCVVATAHDLRIVDNRETPQVIPYKDGLMHPKAEKYCQVLTDEDAAPEKYDYFLDNDLKCAPFSHIVEQDAERSSYVYAQAISRDDLKNGEPTQTVFTIKLDRTNPDSTGFNIQKSFKPWGVTHYLGYGANMEITKHADKLEELQNRTAQASLTPAN